MKTKKTLILIFALILTIPLFNDCRRGENDPWLSFRSRDSRLSAVWTLESGYISLYNKFNEEFNWANDNCEEATGMVNYNWQDVKTKTFNFSNSLVSYLQDYTTTRDTVNEGGLIIKGNDWEDGNTMNRDINFSFEITVKTNGTYRVYITYNLDETEYPNPEDAGFTQITKTFSGTYEYTDNWHWQDDAVGTESGVYFTGFPVLNITLKAKYDLTDENRFLYNYVENIGFVNEEKIFEIDQLEHKNLTIMANDAENSYYQEYTNYESILDGDPIPCEGTLTFSNNNQNNHIYKFTSDGKNVEQ